MENKKQNKIIIFNLISSFILQGISFFIAPVFSALLGKANYGVVGIYNTWVSIFVTVFTLQAATTISIARSNFPMEDQQKYQSSVLSLALLLYAVFSGILLLFLSGREEIIGLKKGMLVFALLQGMGSYCLGTLQGKFTYEFEAVKNFIISVSFTIINVCISLFFVYRMPAETNYLGRVYGQCIVCGTYGLFAFLYIFFRGKTFYNKEYWKFTLPIALPTVFHSLAGLLLNQSDRLMLRWLIDESAVGVYTLAATFSSVITALWHAFNNSWVPFYFEYTRLNQTEEMKKKAANYIELFTIIVCGFLLLSPDVFRYAFAKPEYWPGTHFIPLFVLGHYFVFLYSFPVNYEFYYKRTKLIATATIIAAFCNVVLNYAFIKAFGIIGAVIATSISHGIQFVVHFMFAKRVIKEDFPFSLRMFTGSATAVVTAFAMFYVFMDAYLIRWPIALALGGYLLWKLNRRRSIF